MIPDQLLFDQLQQRLRGGENLRTVGVKNGKYEVSLTKEPPLIFDVNSKDTVAKILHEQNQI